MSSVPRLVVQAPGPPGPRGKPGAGVTDSGVTLGKYRIRYNEELNCLEITYEED